MRLGKLGLVVNQPLLLLCIEHGKFGLVRVCRLGVDLFHALCWQVIVVSKVRQLLLTSQPPCEVVIVGDKDHVVCVDYPEWSQAVTHEGEERHQDIINDIDEV